MAEIYGVDVADLPDEYYATGVVMMVRGVDIEDGAPFMAIRSSEGIPLHEIVGLAWTLYDDAQNQTRRALAEDTD